MSTQMGLTQSKIAIRSDDNVIYSADIVQMASIFNTHSNSVSYFALDWLDCTIKSVGVSKLVDGTDWTIAEQLAN